ncbi:MAG: serine--tRNA ligase [Actinomycetota bacterium]
MLDIDFIRTSPDQVKKAVRDKNFDVDVDRLLAVDGERRTLMARLENQRAERNRISKEIPKLPADERPKAVAQAKAINEELTGLEARFGELDAEFKDLLMRVPNVPLPEIPVGKSDEDNVEVRRWGDPRQFDFEPKDHVDLALSLGLVDFENTRGYAGARAYSLMGDGVLLHQAVLQFALEFVVRKGFLAVSPPIMVRENAMTGTGFFPFGMEETYCLPKDDLFLAGTSEVSLVSMHYDQVLDAAKLPIRYAGISACFRREAGAAGRDTRGLYRVHMFHKVEQVSIGPNDRDWSDKEHEFLLNNSEGILQALNLPHRVALACTGELGMGQVRKNEVETWMPSRKAYSETHSCSTMLEFQARRANIRYREAGGSPRFVHTLNNTAIASPRILVAILENYQNKDGSVTVPEALRPYMMGKDVIEPR